MRKKGSKNFIKKNEYKQQNINLEFVTCNDVYGVTINVAERFPSLCVEYDHYKYMLKKYFLKYFKTIILFPELSPTGKMHFHGYVGFKSYKMILAWYRKDPIDGMNVKFELITDEEGWTKYITKQNAFHDYLYREILKDETKPLDHEVISKFKMDKPRSIREQFKGMLV